MAMPARPHTLVCTFDPASPRITAWDIHEWIHDALKLPENDVQLVQIDGIRRQVFIKLTTSAQVLKLIQDTNGRVDYKYPTGEIFPVTLDVAGIGTKKIRIANLPPEIPDEILKEALKPYGKVIDITMESWPKAYRYQVANGIRNVSIIMSKHAPSNLNVAGNRIILSYEGQPVTCYGCGQEDHMYTTCPKRKRPSEARKLSHPESYATVLIHSPRDEDINMIETSDNIPKTAIMPYKTDIKDRQHTSSSRDGQSQKNNAMQQKEDYDIIQSDPIQQAALTNDNTETTTAHRDTMEMDMESAPITQEWRQKDEQQHVKGTIQGREKEAAQTLAIDKDEEGEVGHKDRVQEDRIMEEENTQKPDKDISPKRSKKMRMDKNIPRTQDRSRSTTRRPVNKGKMQ